MTVMTVLRAADRKQQRWKNGAGITSEVIADPPDAGLDSFNWRISLAVVAGSGQFSLFPGVDRILTVLEGSMILSTYGRQPAALSKRANPASFPGDIPTKAEVLEGPVSDLNVMTRRGLFRAEVERLKVASQAGITLTGTTVLFAHASPIEVTFADQCCNLGAGDAVCLGGRGDASVSAAGKSSFLAVHIIKADPGGALP